MGAHLMVHRTISGVAVSGSDSHKRADGNWRYSITGGKAVIGAVNDDQKPAAIGICACTRTGCCEYGSFTMIDDYVSNSMTSSEEHQAKRIVSCSVTGTATSLARGQLLR